MAEYRSPRARAWRLGGWVWLLVAVLNLVIVGLRLAAAWPPRGSDLTIAAISLFAAVIGWLLFGFYHRKAAQVEAGERQP